MTAKILRRMFICLLSVMLFFAKSAMASDRIIISLSYNLTPSSCTVSTENINFNFYIDDTELTTANSSTAWQEQPGQVIQLINCFAGTHGVDASISGVMDSIDTDGFENQADISKAASGVSVQLKSGNQVLHDGDIIKTNVTRTDGRIEIPLAARLYSTRGNATPGDIYSVINLTLNYR